MMSIRMLLYMCSQVTAAVDMAQLSFAFTYFNFFG